VSKTQSGPLTAAKVCTLQSAITDAVDSASSNLESAVASLEASLVSTKDDLDLLLDQDFYNSSEIDALLLYGYYGKNEMEALLSDKSDVAHTHEIVDVTGLQVPAWQSPVCYTLTHAVQFGRSRKLAHPRSGAMTLTASLPAHRVWSVCRRR